MIMPGMADHNPYRAFGSIWAENLPAMAPKAGPPSQYDANGAHALIARAGARDHFTGKPIQ